MSIMPLGDIVLDSKLGLNGITGTSLLGPVTFSSAASTMELGVLGSATLSGAAASLEMATLGDITLSGPMATLDMAKTGAAGISAMGELSMDLTGKINIASAATTLGKILGKIIDEFLAHTHPTGTGPSGPPMPPASVNMNLIKSGEILASFE